MGQPEYIYTTYINTTPDKLWDALINGNKTKQYFFGQEIHSDWQEGSPVEYRRANGELDVYGEILKCDPENVLSFTWNVSGDDTPRDQPTRVTFKLKLWDSAVKLTVVHENLKMTDFVEQEDTLQGLNNGWPFILSNLKSLLETGKTLPLAGI